MNKQERTEIKKKGKKLYLIGYAMAIWGVALLVCCFVTPLLDIIRDITQNGSETMRLIMIIILVAFIIFPLMGSLGVVSFGSIQYQKIYDYRKELYAEQNRFHMKLFWESVRSDDYEEAKRLYNIDKFIWGSERVLCNGILMGIATQRPIDADWGEKVDERMKSYL